MSKSLRRVCAALEAAGLRPEIIELSQARTAREAAEGVGCTLDQIVKSIIFQGGASGRIWLFMTAGGNRVDPNLASGLAGEELGRADAAAVRAVTGFAIGGVAPIGHLSPLPAFLDPRLTDFDTVWAAAGTPRHVFPVSPPDLARISGAQVADFTSPSLQM